MSGLSDCIPSTPLDKDAWDRQQAEARSRVQIHDTFAWRVHSQQPDERLQLVGGLDISFAEDSSSRERGVACLAVLSFPALEVVHEAVVHLNMPHAYQAGYLAARELPAYQQLLHDVKLTPYCPQVVLVDGFGILHPRGCGSASHLGVLADIPTIGVGKNLLHVDGLTEQDVRARVRQGSNSGVCAASAAGTVHVLHAAAVPGITSVGPECDASVATARSHGDDPAMQDDAEQTSSQLDAVDEGSSASRPRLDEGCESASHTSASMTHHANGSMTMPLIGKSGCELGVAVIGNNTVQKPVYVSVGHGLSLATAVDIVMQCCVHRVPEPIRQADMRSRRHLREVIAVHPAPC